MDSMLNKDRPPAFCPGCSHNRVLHALDRTFLNMGLEGNRIALVSDIGCSGLFDTFFHTHALHGLHGRALTYAAGLKLARPDLHVVVTMGDGGMGIGGAHFLAACRRNLDMTLLILNNFNFGMTGGQFSATTPAESEVGSGFLNSLELPLDPGRLAVAGGAPYVVRCSAHEKDLPTVLERAIRSEGFSVVDIHGICTGRYLKRNRLTPKMIEKQLRNLDPLNGPVPENSRIEYGRRYRERASKTRAFHPVVIKPRLDPPVAGRQEAVILGAAGQRVLTAGEVLGLAGLSAGLRVTQKNEYNITVMTGPSITELILSSEEIDYTGMIDPMVVVAIAPEGIARRRDIFGRLGKEAVVILAHGLDIPATGAKVVSLDFKAQGIRDGERALASLGIMAKRGLLLNREMLDAAVGIRFKGEALNAAREVLSRVSP